ncbi:MAG: exopolysaccharide biosynthesis polyprenyl glycosylphosphotransferase [Oscillospiraceae bacterium]|nr:exopolysaccharide biosynthesis polyprenyl glycosylphosphotransferase [Oscillospiraceae bacterium]
MKKFFWRFEKTILFFLKLIMFGSVMAVFFVLFLNVSTVDNKIELLRFSRTAAIAYPTFAILGLVLIHIYGGWQIGAKKSREIIRSIVLATFFCDVLTFFQLSVMLRHVSLHTVGILLVAFFGQIIVIITFTRFGNFIYFKANDPVPTLVIYGDEGVLPAHIAKIKSYKKQWEIKRTIKYDNPGIKNAIRDHEAIFILDTPKSESPHLLEYCYKHHKMIFYKPNVEDIVIKYSKFLIVDDMTIYSATVRGLTFEQMAAKRLFDISVSGIILLLSLPIILIEMLAIKLYDKGPVIYKQERVTRNGHIFNLLKFRTMIPDAEKSDDPQLSPADDPRITKVGKILRKFRLDELPQLINIFRGDMSFVGPRPERKKVVQTLEQDLPEFRYRLKVKAGLTGFAQIWGKYNTDLRDKLTLDLMYIENYSIWLDLQLVLQTIKVLFSPDSVAGYDNKAVEDFEKIMKK